MPLLEQFRNRRREPPDNREKQNPWTRFLFPWTCRRFTKVRYVIPLILAFLIIQIVYEILVWNSPEAYFERGRAHTENGAYDRAIVELTQSIELTEPAEQDPFEANLYAWRGLTYYPKADYETAISDLSNAITLNHNHIDAYYFRGRAYLKIGKISRGFSDYDETRIRLAKMLQNIEQKGAPNQKMSDSLNGLYSDISRLRQTYMELEKLRTDHKELIEVLIRIEEEEQREREWEESNKDRSEWIIDCRYPNPNDLRTLWKWQRLDEKMGAIQNASQEVKRNYDLSGEMAKITIPATRADLAHVGPPLLEQPLQPAIE